MQYSQSLFIVIFSLFVGSIFHQCKTDKTQIVESKTKFDTLALQYAQSFQILENDSVLSIQSKNMSSPALFTKSELPLTECIVMNTASIAYLEALGVAEDLVAVGSPEYIYNANIQNKIANNTISIVGIDAQWDIEKLLTLKAKVLFCNYNPAFENTYEKLITQGFRIIFIDEFLESHPLGRTEYLLLFGKLLGKNQEAISLFQSIEKNYNAIKSQAKNKLAQPKILSKIMYGDIWYIPGGKSYSATLYQDAGLQYPWADSQEKGSIQLSFEEVYTECQNAPIWMDVSDVSSKTELLNLNSHYNVFNAYQQGNLFSINGRTRGKSNDFYESGVIYADKVLKEIHYISQHYDSIELDSLHYYRKVE